MSVERYVPYIILLAVLVVLVSVVVFLTKHNTLEETAVDGPTDDVRDLTYAEKALSDVSRDRDSQPQPWQLTSRDSGDDEYQPDRDLGIENMLEREEPYLPEKDGNGPSDYQKERDEDESGNIQNSDGTSANLGSDRDTLVPITYDVERDQVSEDGYLPERD